MALRILLADDSMTAQNMGKKILTDAGFDVITVSNGAAAVKKLAESSPDIAILDVYMPGYTGLEVCERMKSAPATARVPVLLSVGKMEPFRPEDGMKVKADGVIIKPFEATDLVTVVDKLAERSYGPDAKSKGVVPAAPAEVKHDAANPPSNPEDPTNTLQEPVPIPQETAEGLLQTFAPVADSGQAVAPEPGIEFTSAPKTGVVLNDPLEDLLPTSLQPEPEANGPLATVEEQTLEEQVVSPDPEPAPDVPLQEVALAAPWEVTSVPQVESTPEAPEVKDEAGESVASTMAKAAVAGADGTGEVSWTAVEAEVSDQDFDIDLEAEMQAIAGEQAMQVSPAAEAQHIAPVETAAPFLTPLGKTSFDEFDDVMEQLAVPADTAAPASAEVVAEIPVAQVPEQDSPEQDAPQELPLLSDDELSGLLGSPDLLDSDEMILPLEAATPVETIPAEITVADAAPEEPTLAKEDAIAEPETATILEAAVGSAEVQDSAPEETSGETRPAQTAAERDALAYYGLMDGESEDFLSDPIESDPIERTDELLSAVGEEHDSPMREASAVREQIVDEASVGNPFDVPQDDALTADSFDILEDEVPDVDSTDVPQGIAAGRVLEDVPEEDVPEEVADPVIEDAVAAAVLEDVAAAPVTAAAPLTEVAPSEPTPSEPQPGEPEPSTHAPLEEIVALVAMPAAAVAEHPARAVAAVAVAPANDDAMINSMVERVVDRVTDRLKPILVVMVEEILAELKSRR